jgi:hypothetical protein
MFLLFRVVIDSIVSLRHRFATLVLDRCLYLRNSKANRKFLKTLEDEKLRAGIFREFANLVNSQFSIGQPDDARGKCTFSRQAKTLRNHRRHVPSEAFRRAQERGPRIGFTANAPGL